MKKYIDLPFRYTVEYYKELIKYYSWKTAICSSAVIIIEILMDYFDLPSLIISKINSSAFIIIILGVIILLSIFFLNKWYKLFSCQSICFFDFGLLCIQISVILVIIIKLIMNPCSMLLYFNIILLVIASIIIFFRIKYVKKGQLEQKYFKKTLYSLRDVYNNNIDAGEDTPIMIEEKDVNYDMLNRDALIIQIVLSIESCLSNQAFVIGIEGPWGCGKTTIINNVKKQLELKKQINKLEQKDKDEILIIDEFDPWTFENAEAMTLSLYNSILSKIGFPKKTYKNKKIIQSICEIVADKINFGRLLNALTIDSMSAYERLLCLREDVNKFLMQQNKKIIIVVDNLDRANSENIVCFLKVISTILNLSKVIYVLAYDEERLNTILGETNEMHYKYSEKIINQVIPVQQISQERKEEIVGKTLNNIINHYRMNIPYDNQLVIKNCIIDNCEDLRTLSRIINSVFLTACSKKGMLNPTILLLVELLRFLSTDCIKLIYKYKDIFISKDLEMEKRLFSTDKGKTNHINELKVELEKMENKKPIPIIYSIFPDIMKFIENEKYIEDYWKYKINEKMEIDIQSWYYFDLYFSHGGNMHIEIDMDIREFIEKQCKELSFLNSQKIFMEKMNKIQQNDQKEWMECFQENLFRVYDKQIYIAYGLYNNLSILDDLPMFLQANARDRAVHIISVILQNESLENVKKFAEEIKKEYKYIGDLRIIVAWLEKHDPDSSKRKIIQDTYEEICKTILRDKINLYDSKYYKRLNIYGLIGKDDAKISNEEIITYIQEYLDEYFYRILGDAVNISISNKYGYVIDRSALEKLCGNLKEIDERINKINPQNESQQFVKELYLKSLDNSDEKVISLDTPFEFDL